MDLLVSLMQGKEWKKGNVKEGLDTIDSKLTALQTSLAPTLDGQTFQDVKNEAKKNYNTFFCLSHDGDMVTQAQLNDGNSGTSMFQPGEPPDTNQVECKKPNLDASKLGKLIKTTDGKFYYVNNYGYIKKVGDSTGDLDPSCNAKTIFDHTGDENSLSSLTSGTGSKLYNSSVTKDIYNANKGTMAQDLKRCDDANYNVKFCAPGQSPSCNSDSTDGCVQCQHAYLSPKSELHVYGTWDAKSGSEESPPVVYSGAKHTACGKLGLMQTGNSFLESDNKFPVQTQDKFNNIDSTTRNLRAAAITNCFPYSDDTTIDGEYKTRLTNKITSDLKIDELSQQFQSNINRYNTIQQDLNAAASNAVDTNAHQTAQDYERSIIELKKTLNKYDSENKFEDYKRILDSSKMQQLLWLGSAISLVIVAIARIKNI